MVDSPKQTTYPSSRSKHTYTVAYQGRIGGFYLFRLATPGYTSLDAMTLRNKINEWLMFSVPGCHFGNGFPHLGLKPKKIKATDFFILAGTVDGARAIKDRFSLK